MKNNMKKRLLAVLMALFGICSCTVVCYSTPINKVAQNQLQGQWIDVKHNISYTFNNDTLYIDEINNEGNMYLYKVDNNIIHCIECNDPLGYNEELHIVVLEINKDTIIILVNKDIIEIKKILSL